MKPLWALTTASIRLGMVSVSLLLLFWGLSPILWWQPLSTFSHYLVGPTACLQPSPTCPNNVLELRYGKYASRGKTVISWFSKNCWNFLALWAKKLLCTNKKISTKLFSSIWDHFLFQQELIWSGFDISSQNNQALFGPYGGLYLKHELIHHHGLVLDMYMSLENMWLTSCRIWALSSAL